MKRYDFTLNGNRDPRVMGLLGKTDRRTLAVWAIDCVERVLPWFEQKYPGDYRPRKAVITLRQWIVTGTFRMAVIRKASLGSHAAARDVGEDDAARSAARAAGQAVATAHVAGHAVGAAIYALQAVFRNAEPAEAEAAVAAEREWQYRHLLELGKHHALWAVPVVELFRRAIYPSDLHIPNLLKFSHVKMEIAKRKAQKRRGPVLTARVRTIRSSAI